MPKLLSQECAEDRQGRLRSEQYMEGCEVRMMPGNETLEAFFAIKWPCSG